LQTKFDRRSVIAMTGMLALPARAWAEPQSTITIGAPGTEGVTVPEDFLGLSYETPQLYNDAFFAPGNGALIEAFRRIAPRGVLRFGGSLSAYSRWRRPGADLGSVKEETAIGEQRNWEWKLLDPPLAHPITGAITPKALLALREFLDTTGWRCIYGLNFGSGTVARAVDEADHVHRILGRRLLCFQLGNEADFWAGNPLLRRKDYSFDLYWDEYRSFVRAIRARVPNAPFAGPDVAVNLDWLARFAERAHGDALFCSGHYYGMGPASDPRMNAQKLLANGNEKLAQEMAAVGQIATRTGMRFRMTEGNSCFGGGKAGVSDAFASALWGFDYALQTASAGYLGINLHGGGEGLYTPIASSRSGQVLRPLHYGMAAFAPFLGTRLRPCPIAEAVNATAYLAEDGRARLLAIVNKTSQPVAIRFADKLDLSVRPSAARLLTAPALDDRANTRIEPVAPNGTSLPTVLPYSALTLYWDRAA
jgi:hypothetical protein